MKIFTTIVLLCAFCFGFAQKLPSNPRVGTCYVKCVNSNGKKQGWKEVDCKLVKKENDLKLNNLTRGVFDEKDRKVLNRTLLKVLKKGYTIELLSHYFSEKSDSINQLRSLQNGKSLYTYLKTQGVNSNQIVISAYGNTKPLINCINNVVCKDYYKLNTRINYRVINFNSNLKGTWSFDNKNKMWCYKNN